MLSLTPAQTLSLLLSPLFHGIKCAIGLHIFQNCNFSKITLSFLLCRSSSRSITLSLFLTTAPYTPSTMGRCGSCRSQTHHFCFVHQEFVCEPCLVSDQPPQHTRVSIKTLSFHKPASLISPYPEPSKIATH